MSSALSSGRRRRRRRLRQRSGRGDDEGNEGGEDETSVPLDVQIRQSAWYQREERSSKLAAAAAVSAASAVEVSADSNDDVSQAEFLGVKAALEEQTDLGLHFNEKGNQICQLSWADFSQRVPAYWTERHPNVCPLCKKRLSSRFSLSRHYIDVHHREEKKLPPPAPCRFCSKILYNQSTLNRHVMTVHKDAAMAVAAGATGRTAYDSSSPSAAPAATTGAGLSTGYFCALCQQRHQRKSEVMQHMQLLKLQTSPRADQADRGSRQPSGGVADESVSAEEGSSAPEVPDSPLISPALTTSLRELTAVAAAMASAAFSCSVCGRTFTDQERLIAHLAGHLRDNHTDSLPSGLCPLCELTVPQLASHIRDAHCRVCARCGLILPEALMERHLTAHDLKMAFWCPVCGQREDRRQKMMQHISDRHEFIAEGSQFQCGSCGHVRTQNLITHCLKHARDDALTAYWFKADGTRRDERAGPGAQGERAAREVGQMRMLSPLEQRGLEAGRVLRSASDDDASVQWLPVAAAEPAASAAAAGVSVHLLQACDGMPGGGLDAVALLSAALCPVCAAPTPSGRQLGAHLQRHGELPILFCPGCPRTFCRPERARRHRCGRLLCLLCGLQVASSHVAPHWALHAGDDPVCALLTPLDGDDDSADSDEEPPCGLLERQLARQLAGLKQEPVDIEEDEEEEEDEMGEMTGGQAFEEEEDGDGGEVDGGGNGEVKCRDAEGEANHESGESDANAEKRDEENQIRNESAEKANSKDKNGFKVSDVETNCASDGRNTSGEKHELTNGLDQELNGVISRELPGKTEKRRSQSDEHGASESTTTSQNNVSDESSQLEKPPAGEPQTEDTAARDSEGVETPAGREARSECRSPPRKRRRSLSSSGSGGGSSSSPGDRLEGSSPTSTFRPADAAAAAAESAESDAEESESLACDLCPRRLRSVSQLRRHRLYRHGEWRGPLRCHRCPRRFFLAAHRRLHVCAGEDGAGGARPCCGRCGAEPAAGRPACLVSAAGRRLRLTVCARCDCPLPGPDSSGSGSDSERAPGSGRLSPHTVPPQGAAVCGECDAPLAAGAAALLQEQGAAETPGPAAARLCVPCAEQRLAAEPRLAARLWRSEATLGALWCPSCCQPQVSLHQLRLHSLRQHADVM